MSTDRRAPLATPSPRDRLRRRLRHARTRWTCTMNGSTLRSSPEGEGVKKTVRVPEGARRFTSWLIRDSLIRRVDGDGETATRECGRWGRLDDAFFSFSSSSSSSRDCPSSSTARGRRSRRMDGGATREGARRSARRGRRGAWRRRMGSGGRARMRFRRASVGGWCGRRRCARRRRSRAKRRAKRREARRARRWTTRASWCCARSRWRIL